MHHPSITYSGDEFRRDATNLRRLPQAKAIPGKVRLVKDLLRVGNWPVGVKENGEIDYWDVTPDVISDVERVFSKQFGEGQKRPLQWKHADLSKGVVNVDAREVVDYWDSVFAEGDTLWGVVYASEKDAEELTRVNRPVSVAIDRGGQILTPGTVEPVKNALIHVALVDQGAMPGQGPFVQMAAPLKEKTMDFAALVESINALLNAVKPGAKLPEGVDESNINLVLSTTVSLLTGDETAVEEEGATEGETEVVGPVEGLPPEMAQMAGPLLKLFDQKFAQMNASLALMQGKQASDKKSAFTAHVDALCGAGIAASSRDALINVGAANDWNIASLDGLPGVSEAIVQMGSRLGTRIPATNRETQINELTASYERAKFPPAVARRMAEKAVDAVNK